MKELSLTESFSLVALNGQDSGRMTFGKKVALRCIASSIVCELFLNGTFSLTSDEKELLLDKNVLESPSTKPFQKIVLNAFFEKNTIKQGTLEEWLKKSASLSESRLKSLEKLMIEHLKNLGILEEISNLLGCDMYYSASGIDIKEYRSNLEYYTQITETVRAELLEEGAVSDETLLIFWLLQESGCIYEIFSKKEIETLTERRSELYQSLPLAKTVLSINIHRTVEIMAKNFFNIKKSRRNSQTGIGVNFIFPAIERSHSIFIDSEEWFSNPEKRLEKTKQTLESKGHLVSVLRNGSVPLLKIDNILYEAVPEAVVRSKIPVQGIRLRRYMI